MTTPPDPQQGQPPQPPAQPPAPNNGAVSDETQAPPSQPPQPGQPQYPGQPEYPQPGQYPPQQQYPGQPQYQGQPPQYQEYPAQGQYPPQQQYPGQPQYQGQPYPQQPQYQAQQPQQPQYQGQQPYPGQQAFPERPPLPGEQQGQQDQQGGYPYQAAGGGSYPYPYGAQHPAGLTEAAKVPVSKPPEMHISLVLLILVALPWIAIGAFGLVAVAAGTAELRRAFGGTVPGGVSIDSFITAIGVILGVMLVLAIIYILFSVIAYRGRNWARILITVLTAIFDAVLVYGLVSSLDTSPVGQIAFVGGVIVVSIIGVVLMYLPKSSAFFAAAGQR